MEKDYSKLDEVIVTCQEEMDDIPGDYKGQIIIKGNGIVIKKRYCWRVEACGNSSVVAWGNSSVEACGNSSVEACRNSSVVAWENSSVVAWGNSSVEAWENSSVVACGNSSVEARGNSSVEARGNSSVVAWENSSVVAWGNVQVLDRSSSATIQVRGNARIVHNPQTVLEYLDFYDISQTEDKAILYKAVRKVDGNYVSDYKDSFMYEVGKTYEEDCDKNTKRECSYGLHVSHLDWALRFGASLDNLAILEVEVPIDTIVLPDNSDGKVRTSCLKVLREVPLEECGMFGKILAKRRDYNGND